MHLLLEQFTVTYLNVTYIHSLCTCCRTILMEFIKGKGHPVTGHEVPEGEYRYSSTLSLTSALDGVGGQRQTPAVLPSAKTRYLWYRRLGEPQGRSGLVRNTCPPRGIDPRTVQHVESRYTDCAILAHDGVRNTCRK
jgi:hypothetical protein